MRDKLLAYVATLSVEAQELFRIADAMALMINDTLSDEFQIASSALDEFEKRAKGRSWHETPIR
jgi:hypothetical protein